jgi:NDP-sugar pyrophosphorylase family protein
MPDLTAILLCGGRGERLKPFTDALPKALVPLNGRPLLDHLIASLVARGVTRFAVCVGYKAEAIEQHLQENADPAWQVTCVNSGDASMTDRILDARPHVRGQALICYGDTLANVDLATLQREHRGSGALATLTVYPLQSPFGVVHFDDSNRVWEFDEKPFLPYWINIGFILLEPEALDMLVPGSDMVAFLTTLAKAGSLRVHQHTGRHVTVNTTSDRARAEIEMIEFYTSMNESTS